VKLRRTDRGFRFAALVALSTVAAAGCVKAGDPEVAINKIEASLVFGVKPPAEPVQAPVQEVAQQVAAETYEPPQLLTSFELPAATAPVFSTLPLNGAKAPSDCPTAPPTASADKVVEVNITGEPPVGMFRWKREGKITAADGAETPIGRSFERRFVRNHTKVSDTLYTFEMVAPVPGSDLVAVSTYRVNTAPQSTNVDPGYNQILTVPTVGEPERGITLDKVEYQDRNGIIESSFTPTVGLLMLPLPVISGESYESIAVDPKSGQTIIHEATVARRARIDACGELADGWLVDATQTVTEGAGSPPAQFKYSYIVGTQYGGILLNEHVQASDGGDGLVDLDYTQAQLEPDPLPSGA
jgi:hypothetical protein